MSGAEARGQKEIRKGSRLCGKPPADRKKDPCRRKQGAAERTERRFSMKKLLVLVIAALMLLTPSFAATEVVHPKLPDGPHRMEPADPEKTPPLDVTVNAPYSTGLAKAFATKPGADAAILYGYVHRSLDAGQKVKPIQDGYLWRYACPESPTQEHRYILTNEITMVADPDGEPETYMGYTCVCEHCGKVYRIGPIAA